MLFGLFKILFLLAKFIKKTFLWTEGGHKYCNTYLVLESILPTCICLPIAEIIYLIISLLVCDLSQLLFSTCPSSFPEIFHLQNIYLKNRAVYSVLLILLVRRLTLSQGETHSLQGTPYVHDWFCNFIFNLIFFSLYRIYSKISLNSLIFACQDLFNLTDPLYRFPEHECPSRLTSSCDSFRHSVDWRLWIFTLYQFNSVACKLSPATSFKSWFNQRYNSFSVGLTGLFFYLCFMFFIFTFPYIWIGKSLKKNIYLIIFFFSAWGVKECVL